MIMKGKNGIFPGVSIVALFFIVISFADSPQHKDHGDEHGKLTPAAIQKAVNDAYEKYRNIKDGKNADYIPYLGKVDPNLYGVVVATVDGKVYEAGDTKHPFPIESISKVFVLSQIMQAIGDEVVHAKVGTDATGLPFNSVIAIELNKKTRSVNPFVNAGAMATASLVTGASWDERKQKILDNMSGFAGRQLDINQEVYKSESDTNQHNRAIAMLLQSYNRIYDDPLKTCDMYTWQCSINISARDLAIMGATLANGGINPVTKKHMLDEKYVPRILAVMSTAGLYETTGDWFYYVGLPGKSGVGGGILAVVPGKLAIGVFAPPLDPAGNSVKGQLAARYLSDTLNLNILTSH